MVIFNSHKMYVFWRKNKKNQRFFEILFVFTFKIQEAIIANTTLEISGKKEMIL